jgi:hypothetical protein
LEVPENCPKTPTAASKFFKVWPIARFPSHADEVERKRRMRKKRDLRTDGMHISLPTLLRLKGIEKALTSSFNPKR